MTDMPAPEVLYADKMSALLAQTQETLNLKEGEFTMWIADMPTQQIDPPAIYMAANTASGKSGGAASVHKLGVCEVIKGEAFVSPTGHAETYVYHFMNKEMSFEYDPDGSMRADASVRVIKQPKHGKLVQEYPNATDYTKYHYKYIPDIDYGDSDRFVMEAKAGGITVQIYYTIWVALPGEPTWLIDGKTGERVTNFLSCPKGERWKISLPADTSAIESLLSYTGITSATKIEVSDLANGAVGSTQGNTITLDTNAAGYNWFIDSTPADNSEFLPTADANVWKARAGSEAAGKMDMLSVLLHEYGHVLGVEHSADQHAAMAATLQPGTRRLPTADELALMARLVGELKATPLSNSLPQGERGQDNAPLAPMGGFGGSFAALLLGRLRGTRFGSLTTAFDSVQVSSPESSAKQSAQYSVVANPTLTNPEFAVVSGGGAGGTDGVNAAGWSTTGNVAFANGKATLTESATTQTRLNQLFVLGSSDRFLRFTLDHIALDDVNGAPDDAFEVALIDANTGLSLLGGTGLTRSDALLNLQADGSERLAPEVRSALNPDGSRTYLIDLSAVVGATGFAGAVASLSFDLIGFGRGASATSSHVTVRDLKLGIPEAFDDAVILAEDTPTIIAALSNDLDADQPGFVPAIVTAAAHGVVTINADGTFGYTPDANYFGTDSFTYKISDSRVDSNVATVSISVTAVNDAPVVADMQLATLEDTPLALNLLATATDIDSTSLTSHIVTGPAHGVLAANADGSYAYTPDANFNGSDSFTYKVNDNDASTGAGQGLDSNLATVMIAVTSVNDAPRGTDTTVTTLEDTPRVFQIADFGFTDVNDVVSVAGVNNFAAVTIGSLPLVGALTHNGLAVVAGQSIAVADIIAGGLVFAPAANANGAGYASFSFAVQDDGGIAGAGIDRDLLAQTMTINVTPVNDAPVAIEGTVSGQEDTF